MRPEPPPSGRTSRSYSPDTRSQRDPPRRRPAVVLKPRAPSPALEAASEAEERSQSPHRSPAPLKGNETPPEKAARARSPPSSTKNQQRPQQSKGQAKGKGPKGKSKGSSKSSKGKGAAPQGRSSSPEVTKRVSFVAAPDLEKSAGTTERPRSPTPPVGRKSPSKGVLKETRKYRPEDEEEEGEVSHHGDDEETDPYEKSNSKPEDWPNPRPRRWQKRKSQQQRQSTEQPPWKQALVQKKERARTFFQKRQEQKRNRL